MKKSNGEKEVVLPDVCDFSAAAKIHAALVDRLVDEEVVVDASSVERCGAAVAQVLIAAKKELEDQGARIVLREMSPGFRQCFNELGLAEIVAAWE